MTDGGTEGQTDGRRRLQYPLTLFLKKLGDNNSGLTCDCSSAAL